MVITGQWQRRALLLFLIRDLSKNTKCFQNMVNRSYLKSSVFTVLNMSFDPNTWRWEEWKRVLKEIGNEKKIKTREVLET